MHDYSVRGEVGTAVLQAYLPENFFSLEPERIAEFRTDFAAQRLEYQSAVQSIVDEAAEIASEGEMESVKSSIIELAKQRVDDVQKTYRRANQRMVLRTLGMSLSPPAIATFIGSALGIGIFAPAGIMAAVSLFGAGLLIDHNEAKSERPRVRGPTCWMLPSCDVATTRRLRRLRRLWLLSAIQHIRR